VLDRAKASRKPAVVLFLGAEFAAGSVPAGIFTVTSLEEAAAVSVALSKGVAPTPPRDDGDLARLAETECRALAASQRFVRALYSGGTFCTEAQLLWRQMGFAAWSNAPLDPAGALPDPRQSREHTAVDLGADEFTVGRPHPMIDPQPRIERLAAEARDPSVAAIVLDVVIGHGAHPDPAGVLAGPIAQARIDAGKQGRHLSVIAFVTGTERDAQRLSAQQAALRNAGALVAQGSTAAAKLAGAIALRVSGSRDNRPLPHA
jgi:hypothetical protein